jgi:transcriptional regulator with XRE-family HTH domain
VGNRKKPIPARLGEKLKAIREHFGLTQEELIKRLNCPSIPLYTGTITNYEKGHREPWTVVLLQYARLAKVHIDDLVDDELDLLFK